MAGLSEMPPDADEMEETWLDGYEEWLAFSCIALGYRMASGVPLCSTTDGKTMTLYDLRTDTESAKVQRGRRTLKDLYYVIMSAIDGVETWRESKNWGPCPFTHPEHYDGPVYRDDEDAPNRKDSP